MAAGAVASAHVPQHNVPWKRVLLALCALAALWIVAEALDDFGFLGPPWWGWFDVFRVPSGQPYVLVSLQPRSGGATDRAGIKAGDRFDVREQDLSARIALFTQPVPTKPIMLVVRRGAGTFRTRLVGSTTWDGAVPWKFTVNILPLISSIWFVGCALLITTRRSSSPIARTFALILLGIAPGFFSGNYLVVPNSAITLLSWAMSQACALLALLLLIRLSSSFGTGTVWRRGLSLAAYAVVTVDIVRHVVFYVAVVTLWTDPVKYWFQSGASLWDVAAMLAVAVATVPAVAGAQPQERPRIAWQLLPLPITLLFGTWLFYLGSFAATWVSGIALFVASGMIMVLGATLVTYALLKRRVLDFEFVLGRTLVVAAVSLIVVSAFVILEWLLGTVVSGAGHLTGLVANGVLALVLGVSLRYIHRRVDALVDATLFRKRHDDERALLAFSQEAAYVTESGALLDQAIEKIARHTDARNAALLLDGGGSYVAVRAFGDGVAVSVSENDGAILALKTWHKPLDPHRYTSTMRGALALPMIARGRLWGILLLGERAGGEAYAPDEVQALSEFAHGVGSALDALSRDGTASFDGLRESIASLSEAIASLPRAITAELRNSATEEHSP